MSLATGSFRLSVTRPGQCFFVVAFVLLTFVPHAAPQQNAKNVLVILSLFDRQQIANLDLIETPARAGFAGQINFYTTYLNPGKSQDESYQKSLAGC